MPDNKDNNNKDNPFNSFNSLIISPASNTNDINNIDLLVEIIPSGKVLVNGNCFSCKDLSFNGDNPFYVMVPRYKRVSTRKHIVYGLVEGKVWQFTSYKKAVTKFYKECDAFTNILFSIAPPAYSVEYWYDEKEKLNYVEWPGLKSSFSDIFIMTYKYILSKVSDVLGVRIIIDY